MAITMIVRLPLVAASCCLLLLAFVPPVQADLSVNASQGTTNFDIYARGASALSAPRNVTLDAFRTGYIVDWQPPAPVLGQEVVGYTLYRIPDASTPGAITVMHLSSRWTITYDIPDPGRYVYLVTAVFQSTANQQDAAAPSVAATPSAFLAPATPGSTTVESIPGNPVSTPDAGTNYPHCSVVSIFTSAPYYDTHIGCLFPLP